ncbi:MAG: bifunctional phosphoribosylaminoimidazolecarboxamide formyltransferase/IMP cyclohydrolase [Prevotellaceae bacterium]|jgi:phosphoribosylaminoimidazolecarboxamide formyltransferase/IMP cyclohydrolase|nr:bifunctional phosphoribosylaminoimidazolecarboxamide formyltransferase/IMP cyclohydrolase [Prevotellaceae bacterium]
MSNTKRKINTALISVFYKDGLYEIVKKLNEFGVKIYSTGGTYDFIKNSGINVHSVESLTSYPSIFGGRVKTLHPKIFGGILFRRSNANDTEEQIKYDVSAIDLVIVDLYPFEETLRQNADEDDLVEKIDIGGISLIRAAAKNFSDVLVVSSRNQYDCLKKILIEQQGETTLDQRKYFAAEAFNISSHYDTEIFKYLNQQQNINTFKQSINQVTALRYGENPHQKASFFGNLDEVFEQLHGKEISYNNLLDIDSAINLINEFDEPAFAILKHNNACGCASRNDITEAWKLALQADPVSAFGGVIISNRTVDGVCAEEINKIFFEVIIAPGFTDDALKILQSKKNRIILRHKQYPLHSQQFRTVLNGVVLQDRDNCTGGINELCFMTNVKPDEEQIRDLIFANKLVKHSKSNAIVLVKNRMLLASGTGQTSRVDALKQSIEKAKSFGLSLSGAVMASDAFFPFADCVQIAHESGINAVIQPGGSVRDQDSVDYCNMHDMAMVSTGIRHFRH